MQREQDEVDKTIDMAEKKKEAQIEKKRRKDDPKYAAKIELEILKKKMEPPEHKSCFSSYLEEMTVGRNASVHVPIDVYDQGRTFFLPRAKFRRFHFCYMLGRTFSFF